MESAGACLFRRQAGVLSKVTGTFFDFSKVIANYNEFFCLAALWKNRKESIKHHDMIVYCEKLARYAMKRKEVP